MEVNRTLEKLLALMIQRVVLGYVVHCAVAVVITFVSFILSKTASLRH